jgi:orsellinic acid C2-O-methyltransferase
MGQYHQTDGAKGRVMSATTTHRNQLLSLINAGWTTQAIAAAVDLGLPAAMARGARSSTALATTCGAHEPSVVRLLRALVSLSVCVQGEDGNFSLTPTGELLLDDAPDSLSAWATLNGGRVWGNWGRLSQVVRTGQSVRKLTQARDDFSSLDSDTLGAAVFNRAMVNLTSPIAAALVATVDFSGVHRVVDVGGGYGQLLCNLLIAHPNMHGLLFDMAHATRAIPEHFREAGVDQRCELVTGSFFDSVPEGADVYLLKSILHDWDDERCLIILRLCKRAMHPTARLLLVERLAPDHAGTTPHHQEVARADLLMMVANGGCERTQSEYHCLLEAAGLRLVKVNALSGGFYAITVVSNDTP